MVRRAKKKPVEISFITYEDFNRNYSKKRKSKAGALNYSEIIGADIQNDTSVKLASIKHHIFVIPTLEGEHRFTNEDVLIIGVKGEIYPCKKEIFEMTYDVVEEENK